MHTDALDYHLPPHLIATEPVTPRDAARLMVVDRQSGRIVHRRVCDLPELLAPEPGHAATHRQVDLLVFNDSRVLPASFRGTRSSTGGRVRGLYLGSPEHPGGCHWLVMLEARGSLRVGEVIRLDHDTTLTLIEDRRFGQWLTRLNGPLETLPLLERLGQPPLPPYIRRQRRDRNQEEAQSDDVNRYNTVFATHAGSVAAPTAGLHFTHPLLARLDRAGIQQARITLHVGLGTFAPVRVDRLEDHPIHAEPFTVPAATIAALHAARNAGGRIIPVGTTTVRALESLPDPANEIRDYTTNTRLFITPRTPDCPTSVPRGTTAAEGFSFRFTDALLTNFHLPKSTLLAMVAALPGVGLGRLLSWYQIAIDRGYRFYSFGDAMLIL